jgi:hypothetical protein
VPSPTGQPHDLCLAPMVVKGEEVDLGVEAFIIDRDLLEEE